MVFAKFQNYFTKFFFFSQFSRFSKLLASVLKCTRNVLQYLINLNNSRLLGIFIEKMLDRVVDECSCKEFAKGVIIDFIRFFEFQ